MLSTHPNNLKEENHNMDRTKNLLIISCSARKTNLNEGCAIDIYNGPFFKILKKCHHGNLDVKIISAKYGLINANDKISTYEMKMTAQRANELRTQTTEKLENALTHGNYKEVFVELGKTYQSAIEINPERFPRTDFKFDSGPIGTRLHNFKNWIQKS